MAGSGHCGQIGENPASTPSGRGTFEVSRPEADVEVIKDLR
jgi:hypothetical protein